MPLTFEHLFAPALRYNPYPAYRALQRMGRPQWLAAAGDGEGMWLFTSHAQVQTLLKHAHTTKQALADAPRRCPYDHNLLAQDGADHLRIRGALMKVFTRRRIDAMAAGIATLADELLAPLLAEGSLDLMEGFCKVLPAYVIADLLGVPREDRPLFMTWSQQLLNGPDAANPNPKGFAQGVSELSGYFRRLLERHPGHSTDLTGALLASAEVRGRLSQDELLALLVLMLVAGHETTVNLLGNAVWCLLATPGQYASLVAVPDLAAGAVEEALRFESPVQRTTFRVATQHLTLGGIEVRQGQQVSALLGAANRDPQVFHDPDRFYITRTGPPHLAFGAGVHACLGPALARLEGRIALQRLTQLAPGLQLASPRADWNTSVTAVRGLRLLGVRL